MRYLEDGSALVEFVDAGGNLQRHNLTREGIELLKADLAQKPPEPAAAEEPPELSDAELDRERERVFSEHEEELSQDELDELEKP